MAAQDSKVRTNRLPPPGAVLRCEALVQASLLLGVIKPKPSPHVITAHSGAGHLCPGHTIPVWVSLENTLGKAELLPHMGLVLLIRAFWVHPIQTTMRHVPYLFLLPSPHPPTIPPLPALSTHLYTQMFDFSIHH